MVRQGVLAPGLYPSQRNSVHRTFIGMHVKAQLFGQSAVLVQQPP